MKRGDKNAQGARFVGERSGVEWWAYPQDDYETMCRAFDEKEGCAECGGRYIYLPPEACPRCAGTGYHNADVSPAACLACAGTGYHNADVSPAACLACAGTGFARVGAPAGLGRETSNVGRPAAVHEIIGSSGAPEGPGSGSTPPGEDGGTRVERPEGARADCPEANRDRRRSSREGTLRGVLAQIGRERGRAELELQIAWRTRHTDDESMRVLSELAADELRAARRQAIRYLVAELDRLRRRAAVITRKHERILRRRRLAQSLDMTVAMLGGGRDDA